MPPPKSVLIVTILFICIVSYPDIHPFIRLTPAYLPIHLCVCPFFHPSIHHFNIQRPCPGGPDTTLVHVLMNRQTHLSWNFISFLDDKIQRMSGAEPWKHRDESHRPVQQRVPSLEEDTDMEQAVVEDSGSVGTSGIPLAPWRVQEGYLGAKVSAL